MGFLNLAIFGHGLGFGVVRKILDCCCLIFFGWELEFSFEVREKCKQFGGFCFLVVLLRVRIWLKLMPLY